MFLIGQEYHRKSEIHEIYGGQRQGGISTPSKSKNIFIFTSDNGKQYGYKDEYQKDGLFWYTGEGQIGDMEIKGGNKAIFNHMREGKTLHLFEYTKKAYVRYIGITEYVDSHLENRPDNNGNFRKAIIFHLFVNPLTVETKSTNNQDPLSYAPPTLKDLTTKSIDELRAAALIPTPHDGNSKLKSSISYYRSLAIKRYVMSRSLGTCESCHSKAPFFTSKGPYLECHHVNRIADGGPDIPENVIALCPNCHKKAHYSKDKIPFNQSLKSRALELESHWFNKV